MRRLRHSHTAACKRLGRSTQRSHRGTRRPCLGNTATRRAMIDEHSTRCPSWAPRGGDTERVTCHGAAHTVDIERSYQTYVLAPGQPHAAQAVHQLLSATAFCLTAAAAAMNRHGHVNAASTDLCTDEAISHKIARRAADGPAPTLPRVATASCSAMSAALSAHNRFEAALGSLQDKVC